MNTNIQWHIMKIKGKLIISINWDTDNNSHYNTELFYDRCSASRFIRSLKNS